jgi:hypothetical protein
MKEHFPKYNPEKAPAVLMDIERHNATRRIFNNWRDELGGKVNWGKVSEADIRKLSERMFDAAEVPAAIRAEYYKQFEEFLKTLN